MRARSIFSGVIALSILSLMPVPAAAYDPCERATREYREAERRLDRFWERECVPDGDCPGIIWHFNNVHDAKERMKKACRN